MTEEDHRYCDSEYII